ncbi:MULTISPECIES: LysE family translocator [Marinomonas]|uniref:LysE family translocator n=1 Tax=Marinomonas arctica TaxID=383750 RepID=A0A7H1J677_9GAMM|nr:MULTISPECIES: LysE family translocator [Marinomonas]MCS7484980.1 lysine transporter LysE [Marinomonas sp. BSi20414]QNT05993.1 LysE family translocator [Marinomonas arctica]GGN19699.1 lysine transporter LysE [Marinomonas arctica]
MSLSIWFSLFTICLLGAMSPGPSLAIVIKHSLAGGRANGLATSWAHATGIGLYALISMLGLAVIFHQLPLLFLIISYAGAAYLAYLGFNALRSNGGIAAKLESGTRVSLFQSAKEGFLVSILSPKIALFFAALFSPFVAEVHQVSGKMLMVATPWLVDGLWYTLIACLLSNARFLEKLRSKAMWIDRLSGLALIFLALYILTTV